MHTLIDNKSIGFNKLLEKHGVEENKKVYEKVNETNDEGTTINKDFSNPQKFATPDLRNPRASLVKFNGPFPFTSFLDFFPRALNNQVWLILINVHYIHIYIYILYTC